MKKSLFMLIAIFFMAASAQATFINYDDTGSSTYSAYDTWDMLGITKTNADFGDGFYHIFTYQQLNGDFTETFTMQVSVGRNSVTGDELNFDDFYATVTLAGNFNLMTNALVYDSGFVQLFKEGDYTNDDSITDRRLAAFDTLNDTDVATLAFQSALVKTVTGSLLGETLAVEVDTKFAFDTVNPLYFGLLEQQLTSKDWLLGVVGGRIIQKGINTDEVPFVIAWDTTPGFIAEFQVVPEPSTLLLLGAGLIGLVGLSRKNFRK